MQRSRRNVVHTEAERYPRREFTYQEIEGPAVCKKCRAVHRDKHWALDDEAATALLEQPGMQQTVCPGCLAVAEQRADGWLTLRGAFASTRVDDLERLMRSEEHQEMRKNPLARIISIERHADGLDVATTTQFLARHLGRHLQKAFGGDLVIDKLPREAFVRVRWVSPFEKG